MTLKDTLPASQGGAGVSICAIKGCPNELVPGKGPYCPSCLAAAEMRRLARGRTTR